MRLVHPCENPACGKVFEKRVHNQIYCSTPCMKKVYRDRNKEGTNERWREWYAREGYAKHIARKYGLSLEEYEELAKDGCAMCGQTEKLVVDHCHTTGAVRGVLCVPHNAGLGSFHDSIEELQAAIQYLEAVAS